MLSIILPTIRLDKLPRCLDSLDKSINDKYELICVSPFKQPDSLKDRQIKWIIDMGNPVRCQQHGLCEVTGEYVHRAVDDAIYVPNALYKLMKDVSHDKIINIKFEETNESVDRTHKDFHNMENPEFYKLSYHKQALKPYVPADTDLINFGIYPTRKLKELNWECEFETIALAETDLSIRIKLAEIKVEITDGICLHCDWQPGEIGEHAPIHLAFPDDLAKYDLCYRDIKCWERIRLHLTNWQASPPIWIRRFGKETL